jgi:8-oxo-dGTP diphosphatase
MSTHEFPTRPVPAVGAIVFRGSQVLLVRRRDPPSQGRWSIPGGAVEVGETVEQAVVRETREETTVEVRPQEVVAVADFIEKEGERFRWHYVLVDLLCVLVRGEPFPGSDAENARFIETRELGDLDLTPTALGVIERALVARRRGPDG